MVSPSFLSLILFSATHALALWPVPQNYTAGTKALFINDTVQVTYNGGSVRWSLHAPDCPLSGVDDTKVKFNVQLPYAAGYSPSGFSSKEIVQAGVSRTLGSIFTGNFVPWGLRARNKLSEFEPDLAVKKSWLSCLEITQSGNDSARIVNPLAGEVDESYNLTISECGTARLSAVSAIGVLRGLESFSQLFYQHSTGSSFYTPYVPVSAIDAPRYGHRGVLLDVARNWFPVSDIKRTIDALAWSKMNRLHVHVTDAQSWPIEIPAMPEVAGQGAFRPDLTYSPDDIKELQVYGVYRGVEVYFEIDMPGHISSLALSHPELIVAYDTYPYYWMCAEPPCGAFKLSEPKVDDFLEKLFDDLLPRLAPYSAYFHTGGDELNANDSTLDPGVGTSNKSVIQPLLQKFIDTAHGHVRKAGLVPVVWEEIPIDWDVTIGDDVVVNTWLGAASVKKLTSKGHKVIDADYNYWYLDCGRGQWLTFPNGESFDTFAPQLFKDWCGPTKPWQLVYTHDPALDAGLTADEAALVLGGEVAVWSETIDPVNMDSIIWPRAAAAAEALWSGRVDAATGQNRSLVDAAPRLNEMRERLVARGVGSSPVQMLWCTQAGKDECTYPIGPGF